MRVFIVDDESIAISRMQHLLKAFPDVELIGSARKVEEAKCKILNLKPDVVLLDVEVGNKTGFEIIEEVELAGFRPKYIVISAYSQYAITAIRSKVDDYVLKPVDLTALKMALERVSGSKPIKLLSVDMMNSIHLSPREKTVLSGMLSGKTSRQIAAELFLSPHTVDTFRRRILKKMGVKNTVELLASSTLANPK